MMIPFLRARPFLTEDSPIEVRGWRAARAVTVMETERARIREAVRRVAMLAPGAPWLLDGFLARPARFAPTIPPPPKPCPYHPFCPARPKP